MRASFTSSFSRSGQSDSRPAIPQWVSDMGLEWLYLLLSKPNYKGWI